MKLPGIKLYRTIKKNRLKYYKKGWDDCDREKGAQVNQHKTDKNRMWQEHNSEIENQRTEFRKERELLIIKAREERGRLQKEIDLLQSENERLRIEKERDKMDAVRRVVAQKDKEKNDAVNALRTESINRINAIKNKAREEIQKSNEVVSEYTTVVNKLKVLFHEGSAKFLVAAEEQESLMNDMSRTVYRKNDFVKLSQKFNEIMNESSRLLTRTKIKQLENKVE